MLIRIVVMLPILDRWIGSYATIKELNTLSASLSADELFERGTIIDVTITTYR